MRDRPSSFRRGTAWRRYALALAITAGICAVASLLFPVLHATNIVMLFLLGVVAAALRLGRGPAVLAVVTSVLAFDFFFVTPFLSFAVADLQYVVTFAVMLAVGLVITELVTRLQKAARVAREREARAIDLYQLASALAGAATLEEIAEASGKAIAASLGAQASILALGEDDRLVAVQPPPFEADAPAARVVFDAVGERRFTGDARGDVYVGLDAAMRRRGVLVLRPGTGSDWRDTERRRLIETYAALIAIALERVHYVAVAQRTLVGIESERLRNALLAALSHDLRTPLTAIVGMADALSMRLGPGAEREAAEAIRRQAGHVTRVFTNVLEMARLQGGPVPLRLDWQSMEELVGAALDSLGTAIEGRTVMIDVPATLPLLRCDAVLVERLLANLVENAAKYAAPPARIGITARDEADRMTVTVWDEGPGVAPADAQAIFEKFRRGDGESAIPGLGLGLAIARAIAEAHRGSLRVETRPQGGAAFVLALPLEPAPVADALPMGSTA